MLVPKRPHQMIKAMKKLKFWSKKKREKRSNNEPYTYCHPPPLAPTCHHCCSLISSPRPLPSAPPLPPWLDYNNQTHDVAYASESQCTPSHEIFGETSSINQVVPGDTAGICSYQQYLAPNPVYGLPAVQETRRENFSDFFGCVFNFGAALIRCLCPGFRIREVHQDI